jgi:hypothetical protein
MAGVISYSSKGVESEHKSLISPWKLWFARKEWKKAKVAREFAFYCSI